MAEYIAWISLDNKRLTCGELEQILDVSIKTNSTEQKNYADPQDRIVTFEYDGDESRFTQLACTQRICKIIETVELSLLPGKLKEQIDTPSYKVDFLNSLLDVDKETSTKIYKLIYKSIKTPKIDMRKPKTMFYCHITRAGEVIISQQVWENDYAYEKRRSHLREKTHSAVMHPKLVRTMINLSGIVPFANKTKKYKLLDPFCGMGGILIEAMHCGFHVAGVDIDPKMKSGCKINILNEIKEFPQLKFAQLCNPEVDIKKISALEIEEFADVIVTDVPYAKNTKKLEPPTLYLDFLNYVANKKIAKKIVICMPNYAGGRDIIAQTKWKIKEIYELPVHNSLTRELFILTS